nr:MAG TPA: hypothetical protein [Caudoviricetes sp.]
MHHIFRQLALARCQTVNSNVAAIKAQQAHRGRQRQFIT